jgi:hypothetical protein
MNRLLTCTAAAVLLGLAPALAAETSSPPTQPGVSDEAAKSAVEPNAGSADTSTGAAEQSSAPPSSGAADADTAASDAHNPPEGSPDTSGGAMERSSAPPGSSADDESQPNPTIGAEADDAAAPADKPKQADQSPKADTDSSTE